MSLFAQYESDDEDDVEHDPQPQQSTTNTSTTTTTTSAVDQNSLEYSEYDVDRKLPIAKVSDKPYGLKVEENSQSVDMDNDDEDEENKQNRDGNTSNNNSNSVYRNNGYNNKQNDDNGRNKDNAADEDDNDERQRKKKRYLEPTYSMKNNYINTTLENATPPPSVANTRTPPTPILYSPPYVSNLPQSTNPSFSGLYPNVSSPFLPEPEGELDERMKEKIMKYHKMKLEGISFNETLRNSSAFNNPSILEKLISFCEIKENGSNLPLTYYNPNAYKPEEYYDQLEIKQREMEERKERERQRQVDLAASIASQPKTSTTTTTAPHSQTSKKKAWNKYTQQSAPSKQVVVSNSVKVGAVISSAPTQVIHTITWHHPVHQPTYLPTGLQSITVKSN
ncbi:hypothetical protein SAMD00019534_117170 [Acytostelium subglobosum LB1]|uniref:hypothetical protein n=1 Tax=Acytostelium subglobosum LB1 TaxID=1410327 RepID=UPI0006447DCA|nr:hypothetical protein SAMD00019534_117170 [Acytostelium subglobosum LB1]GAM28541.1 hypothetical protein SAMD00019534_117170 [Acytostelium subglobosum LB1]|eukprot:XP_012748580.1 hypothetical protein SAMD00019534_117170 [Acytostelium subglobosum LB1]